MHDDVLAPALGWAPRVALAVVGPDGPVATAGDGAVPFEWASVTKLVTALAVLRAVEGGRLDLDEPAGPPGATIRHLLAHASGLGFEGEAPMSPPERTRIYSNPGFDVLGAILAERAGTTFAAVVTDTVLAPLGMTATSVVGRPSAGINGTLDDLGRLARELLRPTLVTPATLVEARTVAFPGLAGVLPGVARYDALDWGLGFEIRDGKTPHWTGTMNSPETFGHFGASGAFLWVDPVAGIALAALADRRFGPWALEVWPALSDSVLTTFA
jgi:CubicO group peptidase (beta-lactamase class C family)